MAVDLWSLVISVNWLRNAQPTRQVAQHSPLSRQLLRLAALGLAVGLASSCTIETIIHRTIPCDADTLDSVADSTDSAPTELPLATDISGDVPDKDIEVLVNPAPLTATGKLVDVTAALGLTLPVDVGDKQLQTEPKSSIGLWLDLDKDGLLDLVVTDGINDVYWGRAVAPWKWNFTPLISVKNEGVRSLSATDVDGDGFPEIIVGSQKIRYLVRTKGENYVDQAVQRGLIFPQPTGVQGVQPVDIDNDGLLDLVVAQYGCDGSSKVVVFLNQGDGTYADASSQLGSNVSASFWFAMATDVDADGRVDVLAGKEGCAPVGPNVFLHNESAGFVASALSPLFMYPSLAGGTPMGGSVGDIDGDGDLDYIFSETGYRNQELSGMDMSHPDLNILGLDQASGNHLLLRQQDGSFASSGLAAGIATSLSQTHKTMVSWSMRMVDLDGDGRLDILATHGWDYQAWTIADEGRARPVLFRNLGNGQFADVSTIFGLTVDLLSRPMATADVDGDGDLDFFLGGQTMPPVVLRNDIVTGSHWLEVALHGQVSNIWGLHARLTVSMGLHSYYAEMTTQAPSQTSDQPLAHFALPGDYKSAVITVQWPSGFQQSVSVPVDQRVDLQEPALVKLSSRNVISDANGSVTVTAQAAQTSGQPITTGVISLELAPGSPGSWQGPATCDLGTCKRIWLAPKGQIGEAAIVATINGKTLNIQPKIRFHP